VSSVQRVAGVTAEFTYSLNQAPYSAPVLTIYSDPLRTVVAVAATATTPTANPAVFTASYPSTLTPGTYYLSFATVFWHAQPALIDADDTLVLVAPIGDVNSPITPQVAAAQTIVEEFLRHPLAYITGELTRVSVDENGSAELPMRPVRGVTTVLRSSDQTLVPGYRVHLHWIENLWAVDWVDVTYDHGWHPNEIPPIISVIINALALRIIANPESTQRKRVGDLLVDFRGGGSPALTPEDEKLLSRYRSGPGAATTLTQLQPVPPGPRVFGDWW
jgi:hypothetical protein